MIIDKQLAIGARVGDQHLTNLKRPVLHLSLT